MRTTSQRLMSSLSLAGILLHATVAAAEDQPVEVLPAPPPASQGPVEPARAPPGAEPGAASEDRGAAGAGRPPATPPPEDDQWEERVGRCSGGR